MAEDSGGKQAPRIRGAKARTADAGLGQVGGMVVNKTKRGDSMDALLEKDFERLISGMKEVFTEAHRRGYTEGYERGKFDVMMERVAEVSREETPQERRDRVVEQAKADVENLSKNFYGKKKYAVGHFMCDVDFVINRDKRTIVALMIHRIEVFPYTAKVKAKGIAKCAPGDCFNVHIGKAIALRRALGLGVPDDYLNAPQPTEVRVGDDVDLESSELRIPYTRTIAEITSHEITYTSGGHDSVNHVYTNGRIVDDSREVSE